MAESITEGTLKSWSKKVGDSVAADEEVATIETDKAWPIYFVLRVRFRSPLIEIDRCLRQLTLWWRHHRNPCRGGIYRDCWPGSI